MTEILPSLFVGTREDAVALGKAVPDDWTCIAVTEYRDELPNEPSGSLDMAFMKKGRAKRTILNQIAETIWRSLEQRKKVLVHCVYAHERSPLAIVWYLVWSGKASNISTAYDFVCRLHPSAKRRDHWLHGRSPSARH